MTVFDESADNATSRTLTDGTFTVGNSMAMAYKLTSTPAPKAQATPPAGPTVAGILKVPPKVTYTPLGIVIPVIALIISILIISTGGLLRRR
jgi:hypothetical protein